jgi:methyl-accepting chemotaxis protein
MALGSVSSRIFAAFGLLLVTMATVIASSGWLSHQNRQVDETEDRHRDIAAALTRARLDGTTYVATVLFYISTGDPVLLLPADQYHRLAEESGLRARRLLIEDSNTEAAATVDELVQDLREVSLIFDTATEQKRAGDSQTAGATMVTTVPRLLQLESDFERLAGSERRLASNLEVRSDELSSLAFWLLLASGAIGFTIAAGVSMLVARSILRPLARLESSALAVADGDLAARASETGPRELARLGSSLNQMTEALLDASQRIQLEAEREQARVALQTRLEQLQGIYRLTDKLSRADEVDAIYEEALSCVETTLQADRSAILLLDDEGIMRFKAWHGLSLDYRVAV